MKFLRTSITGILQLKTILSRAISLIRTPVFWILSFWGNVFIIFGASLIQKFEAPVNPVAENFLDCLIWSVGVVTTVGSSNIHPITTEGKILMIIMMMFGAIFLWSYMALFIGALVDPELKMIEKEVSGLQEASKQDEELLQELQRIIKQLEIKKERLNK